MNITLTETILRLPWHAVKTIEMSSALGNPCLYVTITDDCLCTVRSTLSMRPDEGPYYNPNGSSKNINSSLLLVACY